MTIKITLQKGSKMTYHSHEHRNEVWTVVSGEGTAVLDGKEQKLTKGDTVSIPQGCKHTLYAKTDMSVIEVQIGSEISVKDKVIFEQ